MTPRHDSGTTRSPPRHRGVARPVLLVTLAVAGVLTAASGAAAPGAAAAPQSDGPTLRVDGGAVAAGGTTTVDVVLTSAPDGLAGFYLHLAVEGEAARIAGASYPDDLGLTTPPETGPDNRTVTLEAADVEGAIEPGAENATLATVEIAGIAPGDAALSVDPEQFDADGGAAFEPVPRTGTVTVTDPDATPTATHEFDGGGDESTAPPDGETPAVATPQTTSDDADAETPDGGDSTGTQPTSASGPLSPALAVLAVGAAGAIGAVRRRRN